MLIAIALVGGGAWWIYTVRERSKDTGPSSGSSPAAALGPKILLDVNERVVDNQWRVFRFELGNPRTVRLELDVTEGRGVTAYVFDDAEYARFHEANNSLTGGQFRHFPALACEKKMQHRAYGALGTGRYVLVVKEGSNGLDPIS
jgi:hypothetical protein